MSRPDPYTDGPSTGLSRRSVLRSVAWAAPVILVATAAPAASASGGVIQIGFTNFTVTTDSNGTLFAGISGNFTIQRMGDAWDGPGDMTSGVTTTVTVENRLGLTSVPGSVDISKSAAGWSVLAVSVGATYTVYTFQFTGTIPRYQSTGKLDYVIPTTYSVLKPSIVPYSVAGFANSPEATAGISASVTKTN